MENVQHITPPFTRSTAELRKTFSEGRLCERDHFGFLGKQLIAWRERRDYKSIEGLNLIDLSHCLGKLRFELNPFLLSKTVTAFELHYGDSSHLNALYLDKIDPLVRTLTSRSGVTVYLGLHHGALVCIEDDGNFGLRSDCHFGSSKRFTVIEPITAANESSWVGDVILREVHYQRRNAHIAREVLASAILHAMQVVIDDANKDFDKAVAVSDDGTKIVHADIVYVYSDTNPERAESVLWPKHCKEHKALRVSEGFVRIRSNSPNDQVVMEGSLMGCTELLDDNQRNGRREFHIRRSHVPEVLLANAEPYNPGMHVL